MKKRKPVISVAGEPDNNHSGDRQFIASLHKGLEVLKSLANANQPLGNKEISISTDLPKATISRITYTLSKLGYLHYLEDSGKYKLGFPVLGLGYACLAGVNIKNTAQPLMQELADYSDSMVSLGSRDNNSMIYIAECQSSSPISLQLSVGSRISLSRSSMGRAYLAGVTEEERRILLERIKERSGNNWPRLRDQIYQAIEQIKQKGFCCNIGEWYPDVNSVGVPYIPNDGSPVLAFTCGAANFILSEEQARNEIGPKLVEMVEKLSHTENLMA